MNHLVVASDGRIPFKRVPSDTSLTRPHGAPLRYPGSKWSLASRIVSHFTEHSHYVEPYFGSGAVFFVKNPSQHEVLNDLDGNVVNFFRVLRDYTDELCWTLEATPWARDEYSSADDMTDDALENARRFAVRVWQGHASDLAKKTGWRNRGSKQRAPGMSARWRRVPEELAQLADRLRDAEIENRPALEVVRRFSTADCLIYADPPYLPTTRTQQMYAHEMTEAQHIEMLDVLRAHNGPAVLSGYDNDIYNSTLGDWEQFCLVPPKVEKAAVRTEKLWVKR